MSRISSYQRLKLKIAELEKKHRKQAQDIYTLLRVEPSSIEYQMVAKKWNLKFDLDAACWFGTTDSKGNGIFNKIK